MSDQPTGQPEPMGVDVAYEILFVTMREIERVLQGLLEDARLLEVSLNEQIARIHYIIDRAEYVRGPSKA